MQEDVLSRKHQRLIQKNSQKFQTLPEHVFGFLKEHLNKAVFRDLISDMIEDEDSKLKTSLYDVMNIYLQVYQNLAIRVVDMLGDDLFTSQEALDILVSYSIAEEGSNNMYI